MIDETSLTLTLFQTSFEPMRFQILFFYFLQISLAACFPINTPLQNSNHIYTIIAIGRWDSFIFDDK